MAEYNYDIVIVLTRLMRQMTEYNYDTNEQILGKIWKIYKCLCSGLRGKTIFLVFFTNQTICSKKFFDNILRKFWKIYKCHTLGIVLHL